jgi:hypothetical protein
MERQHMNGDFGAMIIQGSDELVAPQEIGDENFWNDLKLAARFSNKEFAKLTAGVLIQHLVEHQFPGGVASHEIIEQIHKFVGELNRMLAARGFKQSLGTLLLAVDAGGHGMSLLWSEG